MIRRRSRPAAISPDFAQRLPIPVPRLTEAMLVEAERRYTADETLRLIADDLGVSRHRLANHLRERGVSVRGRGPSPVQVLEMARRYEQGESLVTVGARIGFNAGTVRTHLRRAGIILRDTHGRER